MRYGISCPNLLPRRYFYYNLTLVGDEIGILIITLQEMRHLSGDMVLEGLLTANEMDLSDGLTDKDRPKLFKCFPWLRK